MPYKNPEDKKKRHKVYMRGYRAKQELEKVSRGGARPKPKEPAQSKRGRAASGADAPGEVTPALTVANLVAALEQLSPSALTTKKAILGLGMVDAALAGLQQLDTDRLTAGEILKLGTGGVNFLETALAEENERRAEQGESFSLAQTILQHPRARPLVLQLLQLRRELQQLEEQASGPA